MTTLTRPTLSILLDRLFAESDALDDAFRRRNGEPFPGATICRSCRLPYGRLKDQPLPVSRVAGKLLYLLARSLRARNIVEFGTSFGISTLHLAAALRDNGGGRLIGSEFEPSKIWRARANLVAGSLLRPASSPAATAPFTPPRLSSGLKIAPQSPNRFYGATVQSVRFYLDNTGPEPSDPANFRSSAARS